MIIKLFEEFRIDKQPIVRYVKKDRLKKAYVKPDQEDCADDAVCVVGMDQKTNKPLPNQQFFVLDKEIIDAKEIKECESYKQIENHIDSLYKAGRESNLYLRKMMNDMVDAIAFNLPVKDICYILDEIYKSVIELDESAKKRWTGTKSLLKNRRSIIKEYLGDLIKGGNLMDSVQGWKRFIKNKLEHAKYEESFIENGYFELIRTSLSLGKLPIKTSLNNVIKGGVEKKSIEYISGLFDEILKDKKFKLEKGDIKVIVDKIETKNDDFYISENDLIEVKNFNIERRVANSYISSEFFAVGKDSNWNKVFKSNKNILDSYNKIIEELFEKLDDTEIGNEILEEVGKSYVGIMMGGNILIPSDDIELKWSKMGARKTIDGHTELRLSIRFSLKDNHRRYRLIDKETGAYFVKIK